MISIIYQPYHWSQNFLVQLRYSREEHSIEKRKKRKKKRYRSRRDKKIRSFIGKMNSLSTVFTRSRQRLARAQRVIGGIVDLRPINLRIGRKGGSTMPGHCIIPAATRHGDLVMIEERVWAWNDGLHECRDEDHARTPGMYVLLQ